MALPAEPAQSARRLPARLADDLEFSSRLSSWSNKQHQDKSKAGIISWLHANCEVGCRESIAKEDVYRHYVIHCKQEGTEPLRASMFGKLVHRAFPGVKSSRIGTRGATRHSYKSFRLRCHTVAGVPLAGASALPSRSTLTAQQAGPFLLHHHHHQGQPFLSEEGWSSGSEANSSNPSSPVPSPLSSCLASSSDGVEEVVMAGHSYHYYPQHQQHLVQTTTTTSPYAYNCSQPPSHQQHYHQQHYHHQPHQQPHQQPAACDSPTYSCGPSSSAAGSPSFPSPPGMVPFDSFAYTSASFSSLLSPAPPSASASTSTGASLSSTLACACDQCAHFAAQAPPPPPPPPRGVQHQSPSSGGFPYPTTPTSGDMPHPSHEPVPLPSSFWTSQNSNMMRLPRGYVLPPVVGDLPPL